MADIELVIKIDEELYNNLKSLPFTTFPEDIIANGIPLPKGHGRIGDLDAICKDVIKTLGIRDETFLLEAEEAVYKRIKNAPTIIEADKTEREGEE